MRSPLLFLHIIAGTLGMLSGFVAVFLRKGSRQHGLAGNVFVISMLCLSASGVYLAIMKSQPGNILGGTLTFYLVTTAWVTARRRERRARNFRLGCATGCPGGRSVAGDLGIEAAISPTGLKYAYPPGPYFFMGSVALLAATGDVRMLGARRYFRYTTHCAASLAHVLRAIHRRRVHIPGAATNLPRDTAQNRYSCSPEFLAAAVNDFLANPGSVRKCVQEEKPGGGYRGSGS